MSDEKTCPRCAETVKAAAIVCKHCGHNFQSNENEPAQAFTPGPKTGFSWGKGCLIVLAILAGLIILSAVVGDPQGGQVADGDSTGDPEIAPVEVTAQQLEAAYEANEAAAQQQYGNAPLLVSGTVNSIDLDFSDEPFLVLAGSNPFMGPQAQLTETSQARAPSLAKGQSVQLLCESVGEVVGTPMLKSCEIQ